MKKFSLFVLAGTLSMIFSAIVQEEPILKTSHLRMTQIAGLELFSTKKCSQCHTLEEKAEGELTPVLNRREAAWFKTHVVENSEIVLSEAKSRRKQQRILKREIVALADFLFETEQTKAEVAAIPARIRQGAYLGYQNDCVGCHKIAGAGKEIGPNLGYIADKKSDKAWLIEKLKNPQQASPESPMPALADKLSEEDLSKIADYLLTLRK